MSSNPEVPPAKKATRMADVSQAIRDAASGDAYRTTMFANPKNPRGYNYVTTLPTEACERVGMGERVGISVETVGGARVVVFDPDGSDVGVSMVADESQYRISAGAVPAAFAVKERLQDGERLDVLWVVDEERLYGAVPPDEWFLGAIGAEE